MPIIPCQEAGGPCGQRMMVGGSWVSHPQTPKAKQARYFRSEACQRCEKLFPEVLFLKKKICATLFVLCWTFSGFSVSCLAALLLFLGRGVPSTPCVSLLFPPFFSFWQGFFFLSISSKFWVHLTPPDVASLLFLGSDFQKRPSPCIVGGRAAILAAKGQGLRGTSAPARQGAVDDGI